MDKWRVTIDGGVYAVPKSKAQNYREAEAIVRRYIDRAPAVEKVKTQRRPTRASDVLAGLSQGASLGFSDEVLGRLEGYMGRKTFEEAIEKRRADYTDAVRNAPLATLGSEALGSIGTTLGALAATRGRAAPALAQQGLARAAALGAIEGGVAGFGSGEGDFTQRAPGAALGAALGGAAGTTGQVIAPQISKAGETLMKYGMRLTPDMLGQPAQRTLNALQRIPSPFQARKDESLEAFNVAVANEVLKPTGKTISNKSGREAYAATADAIGEAYDDLLDPVASMNLRTSYSTALKRANASIGLSKETFEAAMKEAKELDKLVTAGATTGKQFKNADSKLRGMIEGYRKQTKSAPLVSDQNVGRDIADALQAMRDDMLNRAGASVGGDFAQKLRGVDFSYKLLQTLRSAVERTGGDGNTFSPAQLLLAVKAMNKDTDAFARSAAPLQELAEAGKNVFGAVPYNSAADNAVLTGLGLNQGILPMLGGVAAVGYDQRDDGEIGRLGASGLALAGLAGLGQKNVYNQLAPSAVALGRRAGPIMQNAAPFLGLQAGRVFNED